MERQVGKKGTINLGEIRPVTGGYGLMLVVEIDDENGVVRMRGHGPDRGGHWFFPYRIRESVSDEVIVREWQEARARKVGCNNPDCWCVRARGGLAEMLSHNTGGIR